VASPPGVRPGPACGRPRCARGLPIVGASASPTRPPRLRASPPPSAPRRRPPYLNGTLLPRGRTPPALLRHRARQPGQLHLPGLRQAPNQLTSSDCVSSITSLSGSYNDVTREHPTRNQARYPARSTGRAAVFRGAFRRSGSQLDRAYPRSAGSDWRGYAEDMGNDPARDCGRLTRSAARTALIRPRPAAQLLTTRTTPRARTPPGRRSGAGDRPVRQPAQPVHLLHS